MFQKKQNIFSKFSGLLIIFILAGSFTVSAQMTESLYRSDYRINPEEKGNLSLTIDNINFFKNNEYSSYLLKGYTLPGLRIQPRVVYQPQDNIRLEAGLHALFYWGADAYPNSAYKDIAVWKSDRYQRKVHLLPFFRAQVTLSDNINIILGNLYGGSNHQLIEPIYSPELNLTADPETGLQILHDSRFVHLDTWINWESFIFYNDYHQEVFTVGLSSRIKLNRPESKFHVYIPVQGLFQHRGGEIDTISRGVQTLMNGAVGAGIEWNTGRAFFRKAELEFAAAGYYQQAGSLFPMDTGTGLYMRAAIQLRDFKIKGSLWNCQDFISLFGNPMYGVLSTCYPGVTINNPKLFYFGGEYSRRLGKGYDLGIDFEVYHHFPVDVNTATTWRSNSKTSYAFGIYFRINPSFLLKNF